MSWSIPAQIEQDIISGKAQYRTFQTGSGGQSILPVPTNAYVVIFGYDFSPAGGGLVVDSSKATNAQPSLEVTSLRWFQTQQISFYTGQDYFPFIHHINSQHSSHVATFNVATGITSLIGTVFSIDSTPITRQVYITSSNDVTITHGLILNTSVATSGTIPATNRTPNLLTWGGSGQVVNAQTDFGPAATPNQFMQPSPKDFEAFGLGLLPNGATDQAWARPDVTNGLLSVSAFLNSFGAAFRDSASVNYFLNLHYALYTSTIPETRG